MMAAALIECDAAPGRRAGFDRTLADARIAAVVRRRLALTRRCAVGSGASAIVGCGGTCGGGRAVVCRQDENALARRSPEERRSRRERTGGPRMPPRLNPDARRPRKAAAF